MEAGRIGTDEAVAGLMQYSQKYNTLADEVAKVTWFDSFLRELYNSRWRLRQVMHPGAYDSDSK